MATPNKGNGQESTILISQGPTKAEVVLITTFPDGRKISLTKHYRVVKGQFVDNVKVIGGRGSQREDGKPKVWARRNGR